jgi:hypothetical protein
MSAEDDEKRRLIASGDWVSKWPGRPDRPEFWRLADITLQLDGAATEGGESVASLIAKSGMPADVLQYHATQRLGKLLERFDLPEEVAEAMLMFALPAYLEAFLVGWTYHDRPPAGWKPPTTD